jgi:P pilus assembly chaperone PapD
MKFLKYLFLFLFLSFSLFSFNLSPDCFDKRIDGNGGTQEITFKNDSDEPIRYQFYVDKAKDIAVDMSSWVKIYPKVLTIKPRSIGKLKIFAKAPENMPHGEYQFYLGIRSVNIPKIENNTQLTMPINLRLKMYGYNGAIQSNLNLKNYKVTQEGNHANFAGTLINATKGSTVQAEITLLGGRTKESFGTGRLQEGNYNFSIPLKNFKNAKEVKQIIVTDLISNRELQNVKLN